MEVCMYQYPFFVNAMLHFKCLLCCFSVESPKMENLLLLSLKVNLKKKLCGTDMNFMFSNESQKLSKSCTKFTWFQLHSQKFHILEGNRNFMCFFAFSRSKNKLFSEKRTLLTYLSVSCNF